MQRGKTKAAWALGLAFAILAAGCETGSPRKNDPPTEVTLSGTANKSGGAVQTGTVLVYSDQACNTQIAAATLSAGSWSVTLDAQYIGATVYLKLQGYDDVTTVPAIPSGGQSGIVITVTPTQAETDAALVAAFIAAFDLAAHNSLQNLSGVENDLSLPATGAAVDSAYDGLSLSWETSSASLVSDAGVVFKQAYGTEEAARTVTLTVTVSKGSASDTKTFTVIVGTLPNEPGDAAITVTFAGPVDETLSLEEGTTLSWGENETLAAVVSGAFDAYVWYLDGDILAGEEGASVTLYAQDYALGEHSLAVKITTAGGVIYSKSVTFTIQ